MAPSAAQAVRVPAPPEYDKAYGPFLANTTLWQNTTMSPQVPDSATVLSEVAGASAGARPDDVVLIDVPAMAAIVSATEPLQLPDGTVLPGDQVVDEVLVKAYGDGQYTDNQQDVRRSRLVDVANAAFAQLTSELGRSSSQDLALVRALGTAAQGRHLALWSSDPRTQRHLADARLAGSLAPRGQDVALASGEQPRRRPGQRQQARLLRRAHRRGLRGGGTRQRRGLPDAHPAQRRPDRARALRRRVRPGRRELLELVELAMPAGATDVQLGLDGTRVTPAFFDADGTRLVRVPVRLRRGRDRRGDPALHDPAAGRGVPAPGGPAAARPRRGAEPHGAAGGGRTAAPRRPLLGHRVHPHPAVHRHRGGPRPRSTRARGGTGPASGSPGSGTSPSPSAERREPASAKPEQRRRLAQARQDRAARTRRHRRRGRGRRARTPRPPRPPRPRTGCPRAPGSPGRRTPSAAAAPSGRAPGAACPRRPRRRRRSP